MWSTFTAKYRKGEEAARLARLQIVRPVVVQVPRTRPSWWPRRGRLPRPPPLEVTRSGSTAWARRRGRAARAGGGCEAATSCTTQTWRWPAAWPRPPSSPTTLTSTGGRAVRSVANTSYPGQKMCFIQQNTEQELETKAIRRFASLMIIAPHPNFTSTYHGVNVRLA